MNKKIKEILEIQEDIDYKKLSIEDILLLKEYITNLEQCYCNRTDCSARIKDSKKYDSLQQRIDKAIEYIENNTLYSEEYDYDDEDNLQFQGAYDYKASEDLLNILKGSDK